jgi:hypothetical protein
VIDAAAHMAEAIGLRRTTLADVHEVFARWLGDE